MKTLHVFETFIAIVLTISGTLLILSSVVLIPEIRIVHPIYIAFFLSGVIGVIGMGLMMIWGAHRIVRSIMEDIETAKKHKE